MKSIICFLGVFTILALEAQNVFTPPPAGSTVTPPSGTTAGRAALSTSPSAAPGPFSQNSAMTNAFGGLGFTNQFGTNFTASDLNSVLLVLQNDLQQALSLLAGFNGNFSTGAGTVTGTAGGASNLGQNLANNTGANFGANLAQNLAAGPGNTTSVAGGATTTTPTPPASVFTQPTQPPVPPTALAAQGPNLTNGVSGGTVASGTNNFAGNGTGIAVGNSDRLLIILQSDIERMLPEVGALTGGSFIMPGANGTFITNQFGVSQFGTAAGAVVGTSANTGTPRIPARRSTSTIPQTLTPTGRK
jgi:hypothetical protein